MDNHDQLLSAFLAGDLDAGAARRLDEHLLECERCWRAVREDRAGRQAAQLLRQPAPPDLADRVALAVEVAAAHAGSALRAGPCADARHRRRRDRGWRWRFAAAGLFATGVAIALFAALAPGGRATRDLPPAVAAVARYASAIPPPARGTPPPALSATPRQVGRAEVVTAGGQRIVLRTWRLGGAEAVVALSGRPFHMPADARGIAGRGMAWTARLGSLGLYCLNGPTSELVAAPVPPAELAALAARLPLA